MSSEGKNGWIEIQPPTSRPETIRARLSSVAWESGLDTFFDHSIPFAHSTGKSFARRVGRLLAHSLERSIERGTDPPLFHAYEIGAGLGVLARHVLDSVRSRKPDLYSRLIFHVTDSSAAVLGRVQELGVLDDHRGHVKFELMDALRPTFKGGEEPLFVVQSYTASAMPVRHIEFSDGEAFELLVRTSIPKPSRILDTSTFPPHVLDAATVVKSALTGGKGAHRFLLSQIVPLLREESERIPIRDSDMVPEERVELASFGAILDPETSMRFNFGFPYIQGIRELLTRLHKDAIVLIHDFGWVDGHAAPEVNALSTSYGATMCHGVAFAHLSHALEQEGSSCRCTRNEAGESQILLLEKGEPDPHLNARFCETFEGTGYDAVRATIRKITEMPENTDSFPNSAAAIVSSLADVDQRDHALLLAWAWELFRRGYPGEAVGVAERSLDGYQRLAVFSYLVLGFAHRKLKQLEVAESYLRKAIEISPHPMGYAELGHLLLQLGRQEDHLEATIESLHCHPDDYMWERVVSVVIGLLVQGRTEAAHSALTSILATAEVHPDTIPDFVVEKLDSLRQGSTSSGAGGL